MTRSSPDPYRDLSAAVRAYVDRFVEGPPVFQFMGKPAELAAELRAAVQRGEPVTEAGLYRALDMTPPPPGAEI
jgi:hypothetical protein